MKRALAALIAVLYLSLASGLSVHAHYCMGKMIGAGLAHAGVEHEGEHACDRCGMTKGADDGGCCHDEEASFKVSEAQKGAVSTPVPLPVVGKVPATLACLASAVVPISHRAVAAHWANAPPPWPSAVPIFLRVRSFRI